VDKFVIEDYKQDDFAKQTFRRVSNMANMLNPSSFQLTICRIKQREVLKILRKYKYKTTDFLPRNSTWKGLNLTTIIHYTKVHHVDCMRYV